MRAVKFFISVFVLTFGLTLSPLQLSADVKTAECKVEALERLGRMVWVSVLAEGLPNQPLITWLQSVAPQAESADIYVVPCQGTDAEMSTDSEVDREVCVDYEVVLDRSQRTTLDVRMFAGTEKKCATSFPTLRSFAISIRNQDWNVTKVERRFGSLKEIAEYFTPPPPR